MLKTHVLDSQVLKFYLDRYLKVGSVSDYLFNFLKNVGIFQKDNTSISGQMFL